MVTTRSADKQTGTSEKQDRLALRSKSEETRQSGSHLDSEATTPSSVKTRSKVVVNVPPSRKRSRVSNDGTDDTENTISPSESELLKTPAEQIIDGPTEIPDSQESPLKPVVAFSPQKQLEVDLSTHVESLSGPPSIAKRVEKVASEGRHQRFGSKDLVQEHEVKPPNQEDVSAHAAVTLSDDDDNDAPEVATSKNASNSVSRNQRKSRVKKPNVRAQVPKTKTSPVVDVVGDVNTLDVQGAETVASNTTPSLKIDVSQIDNSVDALASDDSGDSAFVTARTTRHADIFTTPSSKAQIRSPIFKNTVTRLDGIAEDDDVRAQRPVASISARLDPVNAIMPDSLAYKPPRRSPALPRKANNTLEGYRRQTLQNRATKGMVHDRRANFRVTEDWPAKRRKFVVGY